MSEITTLFWDLGGVVLTNAWDREQRVKVLNEFGITDPAMLNEFGDRHREVAALFETGQCSLDEYLDMTVFGLTNGFTKEKFIQKMFEQSKAMEGMSVLQSIAASGKYFLATLNNESKELNEHRIKQFELDRYFNAFFSSCYLNRMKPDPDIYRTALSITQNDPAECVFIDDRAQNVQAAKRVGINAVQYQNPGQLTQALAAVGVKL